MSVIYSMKRCTSISFILKTDILKLDLKIVNKCLKMLFVLHVQLICLFILIARELIVILDI